jgi:esterase/lipase superfamily enzyme
MKKDWFGWQTHRLPCPARVVRWGHHGKPVLLFPTAGGDCEEVERQGLIGALAGLIDSGRIKVYSIDSVAGQHWTSRQHSPEYCSLVQNRFLDFVYQEVVPLIRSDCASGASRSLRPARPSALSTPWRRCAATRTHSGWHSG